MEGSHHGFYLSIAIIELLEDSRALNCVHETDSMPIGLHDDSLNDCDDDEDGDDNG